MAVGILSVPVRVLTVLVSGGRMLLGLLMLAMSVVVRGLKVMVRGGMMAGRGLMVVLNGRVLVLLCHGSYTS
jgi:hypothetical protein